MKEKIYKLLMIIQGVLWVYLTIRSALEGKAMAIILAMMALNGVFYLLFAFADIRRLPYKLIILLFLAANAVLSLTDQMSFMDYLVFTWNIILIVLILLIILPAKK
jgi:hypothetical protein